MARPRWMKSKPITWVAGATRVPVDLSMLDDADKFAFPCIMAVEIRVTGHVTTDAAIALAGEDSYRFLDMLRLYDGAGELFEVEGMSLRVINQLEYGIGVPDNGQVAANQVALAFENVYRIPVAMLKSQDRDDFIRPVSDIRNGGEMYLNFCPAAITDKATVVDAVVEVWFLVGEAAPGLRTRSKWVFAPVNLADDTYAVNGRLRAAFVIAFGQSLRGYTAWTDGAAGTLITCPTLDLVDTPRRLLVDELYFAESNPDTANAGVDPFFTKAFPIFLPKKGQQTLDLPNLKSLRLKFTGAAVPGLGSTAKLVMNIITDRDPNIAAATLGFTGDNAARELAQALDTQGVVPSSKGSTPLSAHGDAAAHLPVRIGPHGGRGKVVAPVSHVRTR